MPEAVTTPYQLARPRIEDGYVLLLNRPGVIPYWTSPGSRGHASHAALAKWVHGEQDTLGICEAREGLGIRWVTLKSQVELYPGEFDVYRPLCGKAIRERAATVALNQCGKKYDYRGLWRIAQEHLPPLRWVTGYKPEELTNKLAPWNASKFCSYFDDWCFARAIEELGSDSDWKLVYNRNPNQVVPADIETSGSIRLVAKGLIVTETPLRNR